METFTQVKLEIFIPPEYLPALREKLHEANAGKIGAYDHCLSVNDVRGYWRPIEGAHPYQGTVGQVSEGTEIKVEVRCAREYVRAALKAIREVHPYQEPVINVIPLMNDLFEGPDRP